MSIFKKIFKASKKVLGTTLKVGGSIVGAVVPGAGTLIGGAATALGSIIDPQKQEAIVEKVQEQGVVKVDKIEETIKANNPSLDSVSLQAATQAMVQTAVAVVPNAKIDDTRSETTVDTTTKVVQWLKSNILLVGIAVAAVIFFFLGNHKGGSRRRNRF